MIGGDIIAAIATPPGRGGVGIVRVSGPNLESLAKNLLKKLPKERPWWACGHEYVAPKDC